MNRNENYLNEIKELQNIDKYKPLSADFFRIHFLSFVEEFLQFFQNTSQRGGYVKNPWNDECILLPFWDDSQNSWLKCNFPSVADFYFQIRSSVKTDFTDFVDLQEYVQREYWHMPPYSEIIIRISVFGCRDRTEFIATFLECSDFNVERLYFYGDNMQRGHSFCIYHDEKWKTCDISTCSLAGSKKELLYEHIFCCLSTWNAYYGSASLMLAKINKPLMHASMGEFLKNVSNGTVLIWQESLGRMDFEELSNGEEAFYG